MPERNRGINKEYALNLTILGAFMTVDALSTGVALENIPDLQENLTYMRAFIDTHGIKGLYVIKTIGMAGAVAGLEVARRWKEEPTIHFVRGMNILMVGVTLNNALQIAIANGGS